MDLHLLVVRSLHCKRYLRELKVDLGSPFRPNYLSFRGGSSKCEIKLIGPDSLRSKTVFFGPYTWEKSGRTESGPVQKRCRSVLNFRTGHSVQV